MKNLKIAYLNWDSNACNHRRFSQFSKIAKIPAELYNPAKTYDIIVVSQSADLTFWNRKPKKGSKLIFDFVDSYLNIEPWEVRGNLRGLFKFITGRHQYLEWSYNRSLRNMIQRADAVVCSTPEQKKEYLDLNSNVYDILDFNQDQIKMMKQDYRLGNCVHFAWEGMGGNAWAFQEIAPVLLKIYRHRPIALHLVTDLKYRTYNSSFAWYREVKPYLQKILGDIPIYLYEWNSDMLSTICVRCDIALLPIPRKPTMYWAKPENRLLMLWRMGLPVLASANPAFLRCMQAAGNDQACESLQDWEDKLLELMESETLRRESAQRGRLYGDTEANEAVLCRKWMQVLESVLG